MDNNHAPYVRRVVRRVVFGKIWVAFEVYQMVDVHIEKKCNLVARMRQAGFGLTAVAAAVFAAAAHGADPNALKSTVAIEQFPERVFTNEAGNVVVDFGKDAFGWLEIDAPAPGLKYFINIGEVLWEQNGSVDRNPGICVRARGVKWHTEKSGFQRVPVAPDLRNEFDAGEGVAVKMPEEFGVVTPFRAVEFYRADFPVTGKTVRRFAIMYPATGLSIPPERRSRPFPPHP